MEHFADKIAVVTGGGTGMGRELVIQLASEGCHVATCDVSAEALAETKQRADNGAPAGTRVTTHLADVSDEQAVLAFADAVASEHSTDHINLLFNNAGIGGGGSIVNGDRAEWERTFAVDWGGVYFGTRAFLPLLLASAEGHVINTSSVNGLWASLGPRNPHSSYSAAKFAVRGFTEALIADFRVNAPHLHASVVFPGHIGTEIVRNSERAHGRASDMLDDDQLGDTRDLLTSLGFPADDLSADDVRKGAEMIADGFRDLAPTSAAQAATIILDGVRQGQWRILVGDDAAALDAEVRANPADVYEPEFFAHLQAKGVFSLAR